jgi:hypothetical protein
VIETITDDATGDALIERVVASTIGPFDLAGLYLGQRLGLSRALRDGAAAVRARDHRRQRGDRG